MVATEILIFLFTALVVAYLWSTRRPKNYPPGPRPWPVVGNLFQLSRTKARHEQFTQLGEKYGDIVGLYFGFKPVVILNNYKHIREAFAENVFSGRDITKLIMIRNLGGRRGVLLNDGPGWLEQRRFALKTLRDFGFGKKSMESIIMEEVNELIGSFKKELGVPIVTKNRFNIAVLNGLWAILTGERFRHDDPKLISIMQTLNHIVSKRPLISILMNIFPTLLIIRKLLPFLFETPGKKFGEEMNKMIQKIIEQHQETLQEDSPRDFLDVYLNEVKKTTDPSSSFYGDEAILGLRILFMDLFIAGAETTSTTLVWAFLTLGVYSKVQDKLHNEIKSVVGFSRHVSLNDRQDLPYLEATCMEILRFSSLVSTGVPHTAYEETQFHGFTIPKGAMIIPNLINGTRSSEAWNDPLIFRPERFITPEGKCLVRNDAFIPFSTGRRVCLGETLAKDELYLFMGNIFQQLQVKLVDGEPAPSLVAEPYSDTVLVPVPHKLILLDRQSSI